MSSRQKRNLDRRRSRTDAHRPCATAQAGDPGPRIRVSAFLEEGGKVLLVRQRRGESTYWLLPGGGLERGETLTEALEREMLEECRLVVRCSGPPLAVVQTISPDAGASRHLIQIVFPVATPERDPASHAVDPGSMRVDPAIEELSWFDSPALSELILHPPIQHLLLAWLDPETGVGRVPPLPCVVTGALWAPE